VRILASLFHPRGSWPFSGSERRFCHLTEEWAREGVETFALEPTPFACNSLPAGYHPQTVALPNAGLIRQFASWVLGATRLGIELGSRSSFDVVYATNNNLFNLLATKAIADRLSLPCVTVVHHLRWVDYRETAGKDPDGHLDLARFLHVLGREGLTIPQALARGIGASEEARLLPSFDGFTTVSPAIGRQLATFLPRDRVFLAMNALSDPPHSSNNPTPRGARALFVGRLDEGKGALDLIRLWEMVLERSPGARLSIVGEGVLRKRAIQEVRKRNLESSIRLLGFLEDREVEELRQESRFFLSLSRMEGFGIAIGEALRVGLPVVAWDIPPLREVFGSCAATFLCSEGNLEEAAKVAANLLTVPEDQWTDLSRKASQYEQRSSWKDTAAAELNALKQIVGECPSNR